MIAWRLGGGWMFGSGCGRGVLSEGFGEGVVEGAGEPTVAMVVHLFGLLFKLLFIY